jgi:signal transduction histidine kinase
MDLFRIIQEAVSNAVRHGHATKIDISLSESEFGITLSVSDNGLGMPSLNLEQNGLGLHIIAARTNFLGGKIPFRHAEKGGTELICEVPSMCDDR